MQDFFRQRYVRLLGLCFLRTWTSEKKVYGAKLELLGLDTAGMIQPKKPEEVHKTSGAIYIFTAWAQTHVSFLVQDVFGTWNYSRWLAMWRSTLTRSLASGKFRHPRSPEVFFWIFRGIRIIRTSSWIHGVSPIWHLVFQRYMFDTCWSEENYKFSSSIGRLVVGSLGSHLGFQEDVLWNDICKLI